MFGESAGYERLFRDEYETVLRTAFLLTSDRDAAADIAQEAFVRLMLNWHRISEYERPDLWVRRVAVNLASNERRRRRRLDAVADPPEVAAQAAPADPDPAVRDAIRALPPRQRAAVVLYYYEDRSVADIAVVLGCAESTAKVHLHRARRRLAEMLGEEVPAE